MGRPGLAFLVVAGAADTAAVVSRSTIVQLRTPDPCSAGWLPPSRSSGQAGPDVGNMRGGLVAGATSGTAALVSGGVLCLAAVALIGAATPELRRSALARPGSGQRKLVGDIRSGQVAAARPDCPAFQ